MQKFDVVIALEKVRDQKQQWTDANREFRVGYDKVMNVLLLNAAQAYMSVADIAKAAALSRGQVRARMKALGLSQRSGKRMMADQAATALAENTELLGVEVHQILTSPLAYLPMGDTMRRELEAKTAPAVTDIVYYVIGDAVHDLHLRGGRLREGYECSVCGLIGTEL